MSIHPGITFRSGPYCQDWPNAANNERPELVGGRRRHGLIVVFPRTLDEAMQVGPGNVEATGGKRLVSLAFLNGRVRQPDFVIPHLFFERRSGQRVSQAQQVWVLHCVGQIFRMDGIVIAQDDSALDYVLQFTDISGPLILYQQRHGVRHYPDRRPLVEPRVFL